MNKLYQFNCLVLFLAFNLSQSQVLHHDMLSSSGSTSKLSNGIVVTQTVGQSSVIGGTSTNAFKVIQGFQQSNWARLISQNDLQTVSDVKFFPNPVVDDINFVFTVSDLKNLSLKLFDTAGRNIFSEVGSASGTNLSFNLEQLPTGSYLLLLTNYEFKFYTKIIKQ